MCNLPLVPAGESTKPRLPDRDNWLTAVWIAAFKRINRNAKADFLQANFDRIKISQFRRGLLSENRAETDGARGGGAGEGDKEDGIDNDKCWTKGTLRRSSSKEAKRGGLRRRLAFVWFRETQKIDSSGEGKSRTCRDPWTRKILRKKLQTLAINV